MSTNGTVVTPLGSRDRVVGNSWTPDQGSAFGLPGAFTTPEGGFAVHTK